MLTQKPRNKLGIYAENNTVIATADSNKEKLTQNKVNTSNKR